MLTPGGWTTWYGGLRLRTDDLFHPPGSPESFRTVAAGGRRYLVDSIVGGYGHFRDDLTWPRSSPRRSRSRRRGRSRVGHSWLAANLRPDSDTFAVSPASVGPLLTVGVVPGLDGYVTITTGLRRCSSSTPARATP